MPPDKPYLLITCEHGGNRVPQKYAHLFTHQLPLLAGHRGWDPGSLPLARKLAAELGAPLVASTTTRLLIELNRSLHNRALFSDMTRGLPKSEQQAIIKRYYRPYRRRIERLIRNAITVPGKIVIHVGVHSFTPVLDRQVRNAEIGLLYDPAHELERTFCTAWQERLRQADPALRVRRNYPYLGRSDGLTSVLRSTYPADRYLGIELEINQRLLNRSNRFPASLVRTVIATFQTTIKQLIGDQR